MKLDKIRVYTKDGQSLVEKCTFGRRKSKTTREVDFTDTSTWIVRFCSGRNKKCLDGKNSARTMEPVMSSGEGNMFSNLRKTHGEYIEVSFSHTHQGNKLLISTPLSSDRWVSIRIYLGDVWLFKATVDYNSFEKKMGQFQPFFPMTVNRRIKCGKNVKVKVSFEQDVRSR